MRRDDKALPAEAKRGFALFAGKANCAACHSGWNFSDDKFHDIGLATTDLGRMGISKAAADQHAFKTPSLREIAARAPYMHEGQVATLEAVVAHYVSGVQRRPSLSPLLKPVKLDAQEVQDLIAFLRSLSSPQAALMMPNLPSH